MNFVDFFPGITTIRKLGKPVVPNSMRGACLETRLVGKQKSFVIRWLSFLFLILLMRKCLTAKSNPFPGRRSIRLGRPRNDIANSWRISQRGMHGTHLDRRQSIIALFSFAIFGILFSEVSNSSFFAGGKFFDRWRSRNANSRGRK